METLIATILQIISAVPKLEQLFDLMVKTYIYQKYKIDQTLFGEAEQKARAAQSTKDMQKEIGKFLLWACIVIHVTGCATGAPAKSICILDFNTQMCWTNKETNEGFSFQDMLKQQEMCMSAAGANVPCWYGIDSLDLQRIHERLSQGR